MKNYSEELKSAMVAKLARPDGISAVALSKEVGTLRQINVTVLPAPSHSPNTEHQRLYLGLPAGAPPVDRRGTVSRLLCLSSSVC